jgi:diaminopimelate decarboxylase
MSGCSSKLGIDKSQLLETLHFCKQLDNIEINGIHVFAGSGILDSSIIADYAKYIFNMIKKIEHNNYIINCVDIGGGFGIDYSDSNIKLDIDMLGKNFHKLNDEYGFNDKRIFLELGRYIVGESGYYITEIVDIKKSKNKKHIITAGGINHQRRPCAVDYNHPIEILPMNKQQLYEGQIDVNFDVVDIGGPLCLNDDFLARNIYIKNAHIGDLVVVKQSGAYGFSMAAKDFISHSLPKEYLLSQNNKSQLL